MRMRKIIRPDCAQDDEQKSVSAMPELAIFLLTALAITFFGLVVLYSTSYVTEGISTFTKQLKWMAIGLVGFAAVLSIGAKRLSDWSPFLMAAVFLLLVAALFFPPINGARRWVRLPGGMNIQPSEFAKVAIVLFLARFLSMRTRQIETAPFWRVFVPGGIWCGAVIAMVLAGEDLGTTCLLSAIFLILMYVAGVRWEWIVGPVAILVPLGYLYIRNFDPMRLARLNTFLDPEPVSEGAGYQLWHSLLALGSGNWFGLGFTQSRMKLKYLPEDNTDFILSIAGEELGFVMLLGVIAAYLILLTTGLRISCKARSRQGMLIAFGMTAFISLQAMINIGVICAAFPTKGMPAPMISYGGSNLVVCLAAAACVASVALETWRPDYPRDLFRWIKSKTPFLKNGDEDEDEIDSEIERKGGAE